MNILVLLTELVKVPSVRRQVVELLHFQEGTIEKQPIVNQTDEGGDVPIILSHMLPTKNKNPKFSFKLEFDGTNNVAE